MRIQFDGNQVYQLRAIEATADILRGQRRGTVDYDTFEMGEVLGPVSNRIDLPEDVLLATAHHLAKRSSKGRCLVGDHNSTAEWLTPAAVGQ